VKALLLEEDDENDELLNNYLRNDMRDETDNVRPAPEICY
jgi:hypothetical protein